MKFEIHLLLITTVLRQDCVYTWFDGSIPNEMLVQWVAVSSQGCFIDPCICPSLLMFGKRV